MPAQFSKDPSVDRALRHSVRDGMGYSVQVGAGETYFSAFALFLNATAPQVALISTLPPLLGSSAQIFSAWLGNYVGRRRLVLLGCALQALLWLPILLVPLLFRQYAVGGLLVLLALYQGANNLAAPSGRASCATSSRSGGADATSAIALNSPRSRRSSRS